MDHTEGPALMRLDDPEDGSVLIDPDLLPILERVRWGQPTSGTLASSRRKLRQVVDMEEWAYTEKVETTRRARLLSPHTFAGIVASIAEGLSPEQVTFSIESGESSALSDCRRPVFLFGVDPLIGDFFFNGRAGYRGRYLDGCGDEANRSLLKSLEEVLLPATPVGQRDWACESLRSRSAKVWPSEKRHLNPEVYSVAQETDTMTPFFDIELTVPAWLDRHDENPMQVRRGARLPQVAFLEVKGAFLDAEGRERVAEDKVKREEHIRRYGYS